MLLAEDKCRDVKFYRGNSEFFLKTGFCIISNFWDIKYIKRTYFHEKPKTIVKVCGSSQTDSIYRPKNFIITCWISSPCIYSSRMKLHSLIQKLVTFSFWLKERAGDILMPEKGTEAQLIHSLLLLYHLNVAIQARRRLQSSVIFFRVTRSQSWAVCLFCCSCLFALFC